jgi:Domain of unknown function (DUF4150)
MADKHIADCESGFKVIAMGPDACKVGKPVIPFDSMQTLSNKQTHSNNVNARGEPVLHVGSIVNGTQSNAGKGVVSGTSGGSGHSVILTGAASVRVNGQPTARHESLAAINNGNTIAQVNSGTAAPNGAIDGNKQPCNDPPKTSKELEKLKKRHKQIAEFSIGGVPLNPSQLDKVVDIEGASKWAQGYIDSMKAGQDSWDITQGTLGVLRGLAGFGKDLVAGVAHLGYAGAKRLAPVVGQLQLLQDQTDLEILREQIRLGNVCWEGVKQQAKAMGKEIVKPVTAAWERGDYAEAITRGGAELLTIVLPMAKAGWAGTVGKAGKAGEAANAGGKMGEAANAASKVGDVANTGAKVGETAANTQKAADIAEAAKKPPSTPPEPPKPPKAPEPPPKDGLNIKPKKFSRSMSERRKALLRDADDPHSGLSQEARDHIKKTNGESVPTGYEVSHERPLYTAETIGEKKALDVADNMKTMPKPEHRLRHMICGDQYHDYPR